MKRAVAVVSVCLMFVMSACETSPGTPRSERLPQVSESHVRMLIGNASMVANPEYDFVMGGAHLEATPQGYEFSFTGTLNRPYSEAFISLGSPYKVRVSPAGDVVDVSDLPATPLTKALAEFGTGAGSGAPRHFRPGSMARVLIELVDPQTERSLGLENGPAEDVVLSRKLPGGRPVYWPSGEGCSAKGLSKPCVDYSSVSQFRRWVSQLRPEDAADLSVFGLALPDLRRAAKEKLVHGIIVDVSPYALRRRLSRKDVRSFWVTDVWKCPSRKECP